MMLRSLCVVSKIFLRLVDCRLWCICGYSLLKHTMRVYDGLSSAGHK